MSAAGSFTDREQDAYIFRPCTMTSLSQHTSHRPRTGQLQPHPSTVCQCAPCVSVVCSSEFAEQFHDAPGFGWEPVSPGVDIKKLIARKVQRIWPRGGCRRSNSLLMLHSMTLASDVAARLHAMP